MADKAKEAGSLSTGTEPDKDASDSSKDSNSLVFVGEGLPPLPAKLVQSIEKGDFVNLADLLPKNPGQEDSLYTELSDNISQVKQLGKKRVITDVTSWVEAFCTFAAIRGRRHQETIVDLMAYGALIVKGARDYGGSTWLSYDYQFRWLAAAKKLSGGWGKKDVALWNDAIVKPCQEAAAGGKSSAFNIDRGARLDPKHRSPNTNYESHQAKRAKSKEKPWRGVICYPFSYSGEKCEYLHVCYKCGEGLSVQRRLASC